MQSHQLPHGGGDRPRKARQCRDARLVPPRSRRNAARSSTARSTPTWSICTRARRRSTAARRCRRTAGRVVHPRRRLRHCRARAAARSSQQARFTAAQAVGFAARDRSVNLAEEADYDDAQARLAGIQRLLTIAGYDAISDRRRAGRKDAGRARAIPERPQAAADAADRPRILRHAARGRATIRQAPASPGATTPNTP